MDDSEKKPLLTPQHISDMLYDLEDRIEALAKSIADIKGGQSTLNDPMIDSANLCQFLSISYRQLKNYIQNGEITPYQNGRKYLFKTSEVRRFIEEVMLVKGRNKDKLLKKYMKK